MSSSDEEIQLVGSGKKHLKAGQERIVPRVHYCLAGVTEGRMKFHPRRHPVHSHAGFCLYPQCKKSCFLLKAVEQHSLK
jgi:hypothetical protein